MIKVHHLIYLTYMYLYNMYYCSINCFAPIGQLYDIQKLRPSIFICFFTKKKYFNLDALYGIYIYIFVMSLLRACLGVCGIKHTSRTLPWAYDTSLEPSHQKKLIREKKSRFARAALPQRAKTRSAHYISHFKTTV